MTRLTQSLQHHGHAGFAGAAARALLSPGTLDFLSFAR